jgi:hypothetical protein
LTLLKGVSTKKRIEAIFQTIGKRRKLIGYRAAYDGFVISAVLFPTYRAAEDALDTFALDELATMGAAVLARAA